VIYADIFIPLCVYLGIGMALSVTLMRTKASPYVKPGFDDYFFRGLAVLAMSITWPLSAGLIALGKVSHGSKS
jgi:hypothetical protein